jgi:aspartyl-tRNA(Asn)/glutamyl-tRNA(Gln) amidotransferase subunit A
MHEFAYGDTSGISHFGPTHNPWHADRVPGGSSGGSAAAVAARLCAAALGTDTGGSIRQPAAYCGVVGLKPTYGLVSLRGIIPLAETQDHVGPICRSVEDAALMLQVLAGYDPRDLWSIEAEIPDYRAATRRQASQLRVGVARKFFFEGLDQDISGATEEALSLIKEITASMREVEVPLTSKRVVSLEAYAWHLKFLQDETTRKLYQPRVLERLMKGAEVSASTYLEARRQQLQSRRDIDKVFEDVDVLVTPSCPVLPVGMKEGRSPSTPLALSLRNTAPFNANGIPTISMPCGFSREGLPIGLQISGPRLGETKMFALAHAYEQATSWHKRRVPLS